MTLRYVLMGTAAASGIILASAALPPFSTFVIPGAQAANVSINISFGTFYDRLAPYGSWISYQGRWVWVPDTVGPRWRPYTVGHWVYTRHYGWMWVSKEPYGWATYHYGRWGYARDIGWYWVPGRRWAPAWVAWHRTDMDIAWAPLPPDRDEGASFSISIGDVPDYYWQVVPAQAFLSVNLSDHVISDRDHVRRIIERSQPETVTIQNNIVINNAIDINFIEQKTSKKVVVHEEKSADTPEATGKADQNTVAIFNAEVKEEPSAKPRKVKKPEEVLKEREAKGIKIEEQPTEQSTAPAQGTDQNAPAKVQANQQPADQTTQQTDQQGKIKKKLPAGATTPEVVTPTPQENNAAQTTATPQENQQNADQQPLKKKKKENAAETTVPQDVQQQSSDQQPLKKKKKENAAQQQDTEKALQAPSTEQSAPAQTQGGKSVEKSSKKTKKNQEACDPAVQDCPPAQ